MRSHWKTASRVLDPARVRLHAVNAEEVSDLPEQRLNAFEQDLDPTALQELATRAARYSLVAGRSDGHGHQTFVLLGIGGAKLALPAADCLELVRIGPLVPIPRTPPHILGFGALRGEVITVVDIRAALGLATAGLWEPTLMAVIRFGGQRTGIALDAAFAINRIRLDPCEDLPLALRTMGERWLRGAVHLDADSIQQGTAADARPSASLGQPHPLPVVDLAALLEWGGLVVDGPA